MGRAAATAPACAGSDDGDLEHGDSRLTEMQMTDSAGAVAGPWRYERLDGPGHWMQLDAPDR